MHRIRLLITPLLVIGACLSSCRDPASAVSSPASPAEVRAETMSSNCLSRDFAPTPAGVRLDMPHQGQSCAGWAWASSVSMIAARYGSPVNACQLVSAKTGERCCQFACGSSQCRGSVDAEDISQSLSEVLHVQNTRLPRVLTERELQTELASGRPVMLGFDGPYDGHFAVVSGFSPGKPTLYRLQDPTRAAGDLQRSYDELLTEKETGSHWDQTWSRLLPPERYCRTQARLDIARDPGF